MGEEVAVLHLKDYRITEGGIISLACGLGEMDYTGILRFVREKKPHIQATLEDTQPDNAERAREFIMGREEEEGKIDNA